MRFSNFCLAILLGLVGASWAGSQSPLPSKADLTAEFNRLGLIRSRKTPTRARSTPSHRWPSLSLPSGSATEIRAVHRVLDLGGQEGHRKGPQSGHVLRGRLRTEPIGICREALMPEVAQGHARRPPSAAALADAKQQSNRWQAHWIKRWDLKRPLDDAQIRAIKEAVAHGHPVACGIRWPKVLKGYEVIQVPPPVGWKTAIALPWSASSTTPKTTAAFSCSATVADSIWGDNGYGNISYAYTRTYANDALWLELGPPNSEVPVERFEAIALPVVASGHCRSSVQDMTPVGKGHVEPGQATLVRRGERGLCGVGHRGPQAGQVSFPRTGNGRPISARSAWPWTESGSSRNSTCTAVASRLRELWSWDPCLRGRPAPHPLPQRGKEASGGYFFGIDVIDLLPRTPGRQRPAAWQ